MSKQLTVEMAAKVPLTKAERHFLEWAIQFQDEPPDVSCVGISPRAGGQAAMAKRLVKRGLLRLEAMGMHEDGDPFDDNVPIYQATPDGRMVIAVLEDQEDPADRQDATPDEVASP